MISIKSAGWGGGERGFLLCSWDLIQNVTSWAAGHVIWIRCWQGALRCFLISACSSELDPFCTQCRPLHWTTVQGLLGCNQCCSENRFGGLAKRFYISLVSIGELRMCRNLHRLKWTAWNQRWRLKKKKQNLLNVEGRGGITSKWRQQQQTF